MYIKSGVIDSSRNMLTILPVFQSRGRSLIDIFLPQIQKGTVGGTDPEHVGTSLMCVNLCLQVMKLLLLRSSAASVRSVLLE